MTRLADLALSTWRMAVVFVLHALIVPPSALLVALGGRRGGALGHALFARPWGRATLAGCGVPLEVHGLEHVERGRAHVIVANHSSEMDFYALSAVLDLQWRALMRPGLRRIPLYGWIAERTGHVFLSLGEPERIASEMRRALRELADGRSLLVFAEGRRSLDGRMRPLKRGAFVLAREAGVPVLPVTVEEILRAPRRGVLGRGFAHRIRRLRVVVHPPISPSGLEPEELARRTAEVIAAGLERPEAPAA